MDATLQEALGRIGSGHGRVVVLTGAGISADSGIPTFRGEEGYWRHASRNYQPMELATNAAFRQQPEVVWAWYLYRRGVCRAARPNGGHTSLVALESGLGDRFTLVTQNVDGLHLRVGHAAERVYQIHGNIDFMRCARGCTRALHPIPDAVSLDWPRGREVGPEELAHLVCPDCGGPARPHVLWFDETYDEEWFRFESSLLAVNEASLLVIVGTSGATNLPMQMGMLALRRGVPLVVVNRDESPFTRMADDTPAGWFLQGGASEELPAVVAGLLGT